MRFSYVKAITVDDCKSAATPDEAIAKAVVRRVKPGFTGDSWDPWRRQRTVLILNVETGSFSSVRHGNLSPPRAL